MNQTDTETVPLPHRLSALESALEKVTGVLDRFAPIIDSLVPVAAPVVNGVDAVAHVAEGAIQAFEGFAGTDAAALAAGQLAKSTGNASLDARLVQIEGVIAAAVPLLAYVAKEFGLDFTPTAPAPMVASTVADAPAVASSDA